MKTAVTREALIYIFANLIINIWLDHWELDSLIRFCIQSVAQSHGMQPWEITLEYKVLSTVEKGNQHLSTAMGIVLTSPTL